MKKLLTAFALLILNCSGLMAQNPIIRDQFTADPTARVFNGKVYLYPSHDILPPEGQRQDWFCMDDYHVFSSENLTDWTDHGVILTQNKVPWVRPNSYSMWAPDCVERGGKYYFYFPSAPAGGMRGFGVGVAIADSPKDRSSLSLNPSRASTVSIRAFFRPPMAMPTYSGGQDAVPNSRTI